MPTMARRAGVRCAASDCQQSRENVAASSCLLTTKFFISWREPMIEFVGGPLDGVEMDVPEEPPELRVPFSKGTPGITLKITVEAEQTPVGTYVYQRRERPLRASAYDFVRTE